MKEPSIFQYSALVVFSLAMAFGGLILLANFRSLFKGRIRNELVRKNVVAWMVIFCLSMSTAPMSGGFFYLLVKFGWWHSLVGQLLTTTACTLLGFNLSRMVAISPRLRRLPFVSHKLLVTLTVILVTLMVNIPSTLIVYGFTKTYINYSIVSSIYVGGAIGLIYAVTSYLDLAQKKKFDEKELELSRLRESKAKAELDALHSKVNPHFLYNALNSIADLSITDGRKARKMTIALADLFRYSINYSQNNYSTVADEVAMTEVYLQIEKIRFEDQLTYSVAVEEEASHYLLPRFLLQPLVENAVKHGLKATGRLTEISLEVSLQGNSMIVIIADNGPAFPEELVPGYGVRSVFDKMDLLFPGSFDIHFKNQPRKEVLIHIHKLMKNEPTV